MASNKDKRTARLPSVRVTPELLAQLKRDSLAVGKSVSDYIRELLAKGLKQRDTPDTPSDREEPGAKSWREIL